MTTTLYMPDKDAATRSRKGTPRIKVDHDDERYSLHGYDEEDQPHPLQALRQIVLSQAEGRLLLLRIRQDRKTQVVRLGKAKVNAPSSCIILPFDS